MQFLILTTISLRFIAILSFHLCLGVPVRILKALLPSSILAKCPAHLNLLDLISLTILDEHTNYEVPHYETSSTPHPHLFWAQIFTSGSFLQISLTSIPPFM